MHVALSQDNNPTDEARRHSEENWKMMLAGLKKAVDNFSMLLAEVAKQQAKQEPKPLKPKDEQAEADAMIDAILSDMQKAQGGGE